MTPPVRSVWCALVAVALLTLSACGGSALSPAAVREANVAVAGTGAATSDLGPQTAGTGSSAPAPDPVTGNPVVPAGNGPAGPGAGTTQVRGRADQPGTGTGAGTGADAPPAAGSAVKAGSCAGFTNTTGISDSTITLANIADISGPVPGIFTAAQQAAKAYVSYFNSTSTLCGRKLEILGLDSQTNAGGDLVASQKACDSAFAAVGSMGAFDGGGAAATAACGLPDLRAIQATAARSACATCFAAEGAGQGESVTAVPDFFVRTNKSAVQHAAMLYVNEAASVDVALGTVKAEEKRGWRFDYVAPFDIAEFNYAPYVQKLKDKGIKLVQLYGSDDMALRMARAMQQAKYRPDIYLLAATQYDRTYASGGSATDGTVIPIDFTPLEEHAKNAELQRYLQWLQQVAPGAQPTYFGMFAWSATRLFVEQAVALGGKLSRAAVVRRIKAVHSWSADGLTSPQDVGGKGAARCWRMIRLHGGTWTPYGPARFQCGTVFRN